MEPYLSLKLDSALWMRPAMGKFSRPVDLPWSASRPDNLLPALHSAYRLEDAAIDKFVPQEYRWSGQILPRIAGAAAVGFLLHENAHLYQIKSRVADDSEPLTRTINRIAGVNANSWAASEIPLIPYDGLGSAVAEMIHSFDNAATYLIQEGIIFQPQKQKGDLEGYLYEEEKRSKKPVRLATALLGGWQMADQVWSLSAPVCQVANYGFNGIKPKNPYAPGEWSLKTTGHLALNGPQWGLKAYRFLEGHNAIPSAVTAEVWTSPTAVAKGPYPFGFEIEARRFKLPVHFGKVGLGISGRFAYASNNSAEWEYEGSKFQETKAVMSAHAALHFQTAGGEMAISGRCKQYGFLPNELFDQECAAELSMSIFAGNLF